ncbi:Uncharacterised protein [Collinsella sp. AK_207A]|uniref:hypothetical protein n=1 Tax=Collinsella sp. AK_207A TaxID=2650472 RepID=UPI0012604E2B|nr:hypothetical protein [Collinsella sp. AK_207A]VWL96680.1 Uncharacterised protein [Collinsella sp. AK_207A]
MDNLTENTAANRVVLREDGTIDPNAAALLEGALNAVMDERASELGAVRAGYRERAGCTCVGRIAPRRSCSPTSTSRASTAGACLLTS